MSEKEDRVHAELMQLYALNLADLAACKAQQWSVTNYALVLYAAIFGIGNLLLDRLTPGHRIALFGATALVATVACIALCQLQIGIRDCRQREIDCRGHFSDEFMKVLNPKPGPREPIRIVWLLYVVVGGGFVANVWLILQELPMPKGAG